jgi:hypothetical protein
MINFAYEKTGYISRVSNLLNCPSKLWVGESSNSKIPGFLENWEDPNQYSVSYTNISFVDGICQFYSTTTDPRIDMNNILGHFDPIIHKYIQIKYKVVSGNASRAQIFF